MPVEIKILRKAGYKLNPDDNTVNNIFRALERNNGHCPCKHDNREGHDQCPCTEWIKNSNCFCGLYVKDDEIDKENNS